MVDLSKKRWLVTYTKHVIQKRKVYQDGFLNFHTSTNKLELYDDCQKLLGVKIAKTDDVISSGETLTFSSYLVDIGDLEGDCKLMLNLNNQIRDNKVSEMKPGSLHPRKKFSPVFAGNRKTDIGKSEVPSSSLSPSQKIIKEFKKNEILKYGRPRNSPDATKASDTEWQVLYTTQKTQKAKKYHDGFLRIKACGSQGRQAILYDLSRTVFDSKFLKKDEVIESGKSLIFDGHLVDVGELEGDHKPTSDLKSQGTNSSTAGKSELSQKQQIVNDRRFENENHGSSFSTPKFNGLTSAKYTKREWHALYTDQITQKAKKYHSGFLTLASSGSFQLQATLLSEDGTILSRNFLKLSENVKSGSSFQLTNYLVEVGEARESPKGEPPKLSSAERDVKSTFYSSVESSEPKSNPVDNPSNGGEPPKNALFGKNVKPMLHPSANSEPRKGDLINKPLSGGKPPKDPLSGRELQSTLHSFVNSSELGKSDPVDKPLRGANDILSILRKSTVKQNSLPSKSISSHDTIEVVNSEDPDLRGKSQSPSIFFIGEEEYDFLLLNCLEEHTSKSILKPFSFAKEPQVKQEPQEPLPFDNGSNGYSEKAFIESMFHKDAASSLSSKLHDEMNTKAVVQPDEKTKLDIRMTSSELCNKTNKMDDIPRFDLGF